MAGGQGKPEAASAHLPVLCADGVARTPPDRFTFVCDPAGTVVAARGTYTASTGERPPFSPLSR